ncbi:hypothetical protein [Streptomyces sp. NPDC050355]|uniref:hypothetical protein n=1 Tax=Streptomyces sp. NPDC050355 TaxID=3365609 RepID=UPI0037917B69
MSSENTESTAPSGLDFLRSIIEGRTPQAPISHTLGFTLVGAEAQVVGVDDGKVYAHATTTCAIFPIQ